jgi:hypothetical protein
MVAELALKQQQLLIDLARETLASRLDMRVIR